jgi:hypothetical protein
MAEEFLRFNKSENKIKRNRNENFMLQIEHKTWGEEEKTIAFFCIIKKEEQTTTTQGINVFIKHA